jgi:hypothetical protein
MPRRKSKELVPVAGKDLAVIEDTAPLWTAEVKAVLADIRALVADKEMLPEEHRAGRQLYAAKLRKLADQMESGEWTKRTQETLPKRVSWDQYEDREMAET